MTPAEYMQFTRDTSKPFVDFNYCVVALNGEAGEVAEWHKKCLLRKQPGHLTHCDLKKELGDVLWYLTRITDFMGWTLEDIMDQNQVKLINRQAAAAEAATGDSIVA
jgi:NTP pyrophosphatase (non-canonical NTP hydrolase)